MAKKKDNEKEMRADPYAEGADAAIAGKSDTDNPYPPATDDHLSWNDGYLSVLEEEVPDPDL